MARHIVTDRPDGVQIDLRLDQTGWLAGPVGLVLGGKVRSYVDAEADALAAAAAGPSVRRRDRDRRTVRRRPRAVERRCCEVWSSTSPQTGSAR